MSFGVTSGGFTAKRLVDVQADLTALFQTAFGANVDLSNDGPFGQLLGILADRETSLWEMAGLIWSSSFLASSGGVAVDLLLALMRMKRLVATPTKVQEQLTGTPGTLVPSGFQIQTSDTGATFSSVADATIGGGGTVTVEFDCTVNGPTLCNAGTLKNIVSPLTGLTSATNLTDGVLGRNPEQDADFKARRANALATIISSSSPGLALGLLLVLNVIEAKVIENVTDAPDAFGRPGHSFEAVVRGGADNDLAVAVWSSKPSGIQSVGSTSVPLLDARGDIQVVNFSRPTLVPVYVSVTLRVLKNFPTTGLSQALNAMIVYGATLKIGQELDAAALEKAILDAVPGIAQIDLFISIAPNPLTETPIQVAANALVVLDSTRMHVVRSN